MPDGHIPSADFTPSSAQVTARLKNCLALPLVKDAGAEAVRVLGDFFDDPTVKPRKKKQASQALYKLVDWAGRQNVTINLIGFSREQVDAFLADLTSPQEFKLGLRLVYGKLNKEDVTNHNPTPSLYKPHSYRGLPDIIFRLGEKATNAVTELADRNRHTRKDREVSGLYSNHLTVLRAFAKWVESRQIYDLNDFSIGDARQYLAFLSLTSNRSSIVYYVRSVFQCLVDEGIFSTNPFPHAREDELRRDKSIGRVLALARATGDGFEPALRKFLFGEKRTFYVPEAAMLNHFTAWLEDEGIGRLTDVTSDDLLRYRKTGFVKLHPTSRATYFQCVTRFFNYLHERSLIENNPVNWRRVRSDKSVPLPADKDSSNDEVSQLMWRANKKLAEKKFTEDFADLDISALPFGDRLMLARFIRFVDRFERPGRALGHKNTCKGELSLSASNAWPGESFWVFADKLGITGMKNGDRRFTIGFTERYNAEGRPLQTWANDFITRYEANMRLYGQQPIEAAKSSLRPGAARRPAERAAAHAA